MKKNNQSNNVSKSLQTKSAQARPVQLILWIYLLAFVLMTWSFKSQANLNQNPVVEMKTSVGTIKMQLFKTEAPISTENFLKYVDKKFYDGVIFHRVIKEFMIQGGGFLPDMTEKTTLFPTIKNEAKNGLSNKRGTLAMARTNEVDSASAQFYINVVDNMMLDHKSQDQYGYAVFGEVIEGMDVVDKIRAVATTNKNGFSDVPVKSITIESVRLIKNSNKTKSKKGLK